jgi:hypothetical protein
MTTLDTERGQYDAGGGPAHADVRTGTFDALGHRFAVVSKDVRTVALVEAAFASLAVCSEPLGWYRLQRDADCIVVRWRDARIGVVASTADALTLLRDHVEQRAIAAADSDLVLRGGCVEIDGRVVMLSGEAGCGVSTLLAALVATGGTYLSDDAIPVEVRSGRVRPFPQPLLLDDRSLDLLPEVSSLRSGLDTKSGRRLVTLRGADATTREDPRTVSVVLFPERDDSGIAIVRPVAHDDAVMRLAERSYNFPGHERDAMEAIHWLVGSSQSYAVVGGDPHCAAHAVLASMAPLGRPRQFTSRSPNVPRGG